MLASLVHRLEHALCVVIRPLIPPDEMPANFFSPSIGQFGHVCKSRGIGNLPHLCAMPTEVGFLTHSCREGGNTAFLSIDENNTFGACGAQALQNIRV